MKASANTVVSHVVVKRRECVLSSPAHAYCAEKEDKSRSTHESAVFHRYSRLGLLEGV
jgi:hypothetical protein